MGFYNTFAATNPSGMHTFDGAAITLLPGGYRVVEKATVPNATIVTILDGKGDIVEDDIYVSKEGRIGPMDLTKDVIVFDIARLPKMNDPMQTRLFQYERTPWGYRKDPGP